MLLFIKFFAASNTQNLDQKQVVIDEEELQKALQQAINMSIGCSVLSLMDLYGQLSRVVTRYSRTNERKLLPQVRH